MFSKLFKYALNNIMRNTFLSFSSVLILTLLIFFINILALLHDVSYRLIDGVSDKLTISLYLKDEYDKNTTDVITLQKEIQENISSIKLSYKTKDEVLEDIRKRDPELVKILERQNPLPETITLENIPLNQYEQLNAIIQKKLYVLSEQSADNSKSDQYFSTYTKQFERIEKVTSLVEMLQIGLYIIIITFIVSIAVIMYSIISNFIYYYRDEIYITRLVGGSSIFIYGPFILQGMIYISLSFLLSTAFFLFALGNAKVVFSGYEAAGLYSLNLYAVLGLEAIIFMCIGGLSGYFSSRKYIKKS